MDDLWLSFDTETTGVSFADDYILSASVVKVRPSTGQQPQTREWFLNWGVPIPAEATKIHGLTQEWLAANGRDPASVLEPLVTWLAGLLQKQANLVGMNCLFDLTMLDRNCRRLGIPTLSDEMGDIRPVVDVFVLDKLADPFRKGGRKLSPHLAEHYRAEITGQAHSASTDALTAARVAWRIGKLYPQLGGMSAGALHDLQVEAKPKQDSSYSSWRSKQPGGATPRPGDGCWPIYLEAT